MVHLESLPLPDQESRALKDWLSQPAFRIFVNWLAAQAATKTAEAGNILVDDDEISFDARRMAAESKAADARNYLLVREIMLKLVSPNEPIGYVKLSPKPLATTP